MRKNHSLLSGTVVNWPLHVPHVGGAVLFNTDRIDEESRWDWRMKWQWGVRWLGRSYRKTMSLQSLSPPLYWWAWVSLCGTIPSSLWGLVASHSTAQHRHLLAEAERHSLRLQGVATALEASFFRHLTLLLTDYAVLDSSFWSNSMAASHASLGHPRIHCVKLIWGWLESRGMLNISIFYWLLVVQQQFNMRCEHISVIYIYIYTHTSSESRINKRSSGLLGQDNIWPRYNYFENYWTSGIWGCKKISKYWENRL